MLDPVPSGSYKMDKTTCMYIKTSIRALFILYSTLNGILALTCSSDLSRKVKYGWN